jgi:ceramide glucosyltransferase
MIHIVRQVIETVALVGACGGAAYYVLCLWSARDFLQYRETALTAASLGGSVEDPPVSILKPLKGADPEIYETFRSYCVQDYRHYEIIFGVSEADDAAIPFVQRLQREFPEVSVQLVMCSEKLGANTKVSNLVQMLRVARFDLVVVNDSDIRVESDYLRRVSAPLAAASVGMVTCLYRGIAGPTLGSKLESIGISTDFAGGVLVARFIEGGVRFGLGSTLAFRRADLAAIGGFEALVDHLADDYELGKRIANRGLKVQLSEIVVETFLPSYDLRGFFQHQLRWARAVRDSRRVGYLGLVLTFGLVWGCLAVIASGGAVWAWILFGVTVLLRFWEALVVARLVLDDCAVWRQLPLIPLRDLAAVLVWLGSLAGNTISWRGDSFRLKGGKLSRIRA